MVKGRSKNDNRHLLNLATKELFFTFNNKFYIQVDGVAMGSTLGPILVNMLLSHYEENCPNKCPIEFNPSYCRRYDDDTFVLFESPESAHLFGKYMSSKRRNINFTLEHENIGSILFLYIKMCCKNGKIVT